LNTGRFRVYVREVLSTPVVNNLKQQPGGREPKQQVGGNPEDKNKVLTPGSLGKKRKKKGCSGSVRWAVLGEHAVSKKRILSAKKKKKGGPNGV